MIIVLYDWPSRESVRRFPVTLGMSDEVDDEEGESPFTSVLPCELAVFLESPHADRNRKNKKANSGNKSTYPHITSLKV